MAQTLIRFDTPACGRGRENGHWEAWLEFENIETGEVLRTDRETTQPNETDATSCLLTSVAGC